MSEENRQQQSSAESTVAGAAKTGKAIASIAKGAATGGAHGAAVEAAKSSKKWIIPIVAVILLPVLIIAMLPSVIFGSLFGDGTDTPNGISDDTVLVQNLADINSGISMILSEGLNDVLARIDSDFAASGCDSKEVNNPFGSDVVFNANAIVSQYCAYKDTDATSISKDDMESLLAANKDKLYSFTYTDEVREVPSEPEAESTETVAPDTTTEEPPEPTYETIRVYTIKKDVVTRTNTLRLNKGVAVLKVNNLLMDAAQVRADEMAASGAYSHTRPDGRRSNTVTDSRRTGENIHCITELYLEQQHKTLSDAVVNLWSNSKGHADNMLNARYGEIGVGLARGTDSNGLACWYCVQVFLVDGCEVTWVDVPAIG